MVTEGKVVALQKQSLNQIHFGRIPCYFFAKFYVQVALIAFSADENPTGVQSGRIVSGVCSETRFDAHPLTCLQFATVTPL
jgi:hypothetical protein